MHPNYVRSLFCAQILSLLFIRPQRKALEGILEEALGVVADLSEARLRFEACYPLCRTSSQRYAFIV
jgi:hypothetical protein